MDCYTEIKDEEGLCPCCDLTPITRKGYQINGKWNGQVLVISDDTDTLLRVETYNQGDIIKQAVYAQIPCVAAIPFY